MPENIKKLKEEKESPDRWSFISYFVERMFGTVESFIERISIVAEDRAQSVINRAIQRLFGLLLLGVGIVFLLSGGAQVINQIVQFPGIGQIAVGGFILLVTGIVMLFSRRS
ncbi:MAG: hypothetical protein WAT81_03890 [Candidatus Moraniibacteriota bacterium]